MKSKRITYEQFYNIIVDAKYADMLIDSGTYKFIENGDYKSKVIDIYMDECVVDPNYYDIVIFYNIQGGAFIINKSYVCRSIKKSFVDLSLRKLKLRQIYGEV